MLINISSSGISDAGSPINGFAKSSVVINQDFAKVCKKVLLQLSVSVEPVSSDLVQL